MFDFSFIFFIPATISSSLANGAATSSAYERIFGAGWNTADVSDTTFIAAARMPERRIDAEG